MGRNILLLFLVCGIHQVFAARKKSILYLKSGLSRDITLTEIIYIVYAHTLCFTEYNLIGRAKDCCRSNGARVAVMHNGAAEYVSQCEAYCDKTPGSVSSFPIALDGKTVIYARNAISLLPEMQDTTHLGKRQKVHGL